MNPQSITSQPLNPYFAGLAGKTATESAALEDRIDALSPAVRDILFSPELPEQLEAAIQAAQLPEQYRVALSKIVFLIVLGDVPITAPLQLLEKLGVASSSASALAESLDQILRPLIAARAQQSVSQGMKPLEPLTQRISVPTPPPPPGPQSPKRNILDLRNKPQI